MIRRSLVFCLVTMTLFAPMSAVARPEMFSDLSLAQAKDQARKEHKLVIADFTASWCGPCEKMDQTTWIDPSVDSWMRKNAVAVQIDVDQQEKTAAELKVQAMPTVIAFTPDNYDEFDRQVGYKEADELLSWLDSVKQGKRSIDSLREKSASVVGQGGREEVQARYSLAEKLLEKGDHRAAADHFVWLWSNIESEDPAMTGVRGSFMASKMEELAKQDPYSKEQFSKLRDQSERKHKRDDWVVLNGIVGDNARTLKWFDGAKTDPKRKKEILDSKVSLERLLIESDRWADVAIFYPDPVSAINKANDFSKMVGALTKEYDPFPEQAATIYAAMLAAGRKSEAENVAKESIKVRDTEEMRNKLNEYADRVGHKREGGLPEPLLTDKSTPFLILGILFLIVIAFWFGLFKLWKNITS